jgi:hypothetical protein
MAKKRWATFSVADHLDIRSLVPDVLLFDCLAFPYPADQDELAYWEEKKWDPKQLDYCVSMLGEFAYLVDWGGGERKGIPTNIAQAADFEALSESPFQKDKKIKWEHAKQWTRMKIRDAVKEKRGKDLWVMPCYRSRSAFLQDQDATITVADRNSRREALALLVGQKMRVPDDADPKVALRLAIDLARDGGYQRSRRALDNWQEDVVQRDQSTEDDAQDLADLISDLNKYVTAATHNQREQWFFFAWKRLLGLGGNPFVAVGGATMEVVQIAKGRKIEVPEGPMAAFHHVRERVIEAL